MTLTQEAYAAQDKENLPAFEQSMTKITYTDVQLAKFREVAGSFRLLLDPTLPRKDVADQAQEEIRDALGDAPASAADPGLPWVFRPA
jgi:hypothetical protein